MRGFVSVLIVQAVLMVPPGSSLARRGDTPQETAAKQREAEQKAQQQRAEENRRAEQQREQDRRAERQRQEQRRAEQQRTEENRRAEQQREQERRGEEQRQEQRRTEQQRAEENRQAEQQREQGRRAEQRREAKSPGEQHKAEEHQSSHLPNVQERIERQHQSELCSEQARSPLHQLDDREEDRRDWQSYSRPCAVKPNIVQPSVSRAPSVPNAPTKRTQSIIFQPLAPQKVGAPILLQATATSGLPVSYMSAGACSITSKLARATVAGTCKITASQPGNEIYWPAPAVTVTVTITP